MDTPKPDKINLDLINMVQQARMMHDNEATPSEVSAVYWIETKDQSGKAKAPTPRSGQWMLEIDVDQIDSLWLSIKSATEKGILGYKSKVATTSRNETLSSRMICVRTYDKDDLEDVNRIRSALRELIDGKWRYQADS